MTTLFSRLHPAVNFAFFVSAIMFSMFCMNPVMLLISYLSALGFLTVLRGISAIKRAAFSLLAVLSVTVVNAAFNHQGATILLYVNDNPLTLESIFYGLASGVMFVSVILWFSCYNDVMTSEKFMCLFGKAIPSLSLIFSMALRFVPRFIEQAKRISSAQKSIGKGLTGGVFSKLRNSLLMLTALLSWSLENAVDTADSMKSRGYGLPGRTAFSNYRFTLYDTAVLSAILMLTAGVLTGNISGFVHTVYFPVYGGLPVGLGAILTECCYAVLLNIPMILSVWEKIKWNCIKSKI